MPIISNNRHIIGSKLDIATSNTIFSYSKWIYKFFTTAVQMYPLAAASITLTSAASDWGFGNYTQIVPVNTITSDFRIVGLCLNEPSTDQTEMLVEIAYGVGNTVCYSHSFMGYAQDVEVDCSVFNGCPIIPANSIVNGRVAFENAIAGNTIQINVLYQIVT